MIGKGIFVALLSMSIGLTLAVTPEPNLRARGLRTKKANPNVKAEKRAKSCKSSKKSGGCDPTEAPTDPTAAPVDTEAPTDATDTLAPTLPFPTSIPTDTPSDVPSHVGFVRTRRPAPDWPSEPYCCATYCNHSCCGCGGAPSYGS